MCVFALVNAGVATHNIDSFHRSALHVAAIRGASCSLRAVQSVSHQRAAVGDLESIRVLLSKGDSVTSLDRLGFVPAFYAIKNGLRAWAPVALAGAVMLCLSQTSRRRSSHS
jgi:hypothetical protein